MNLVSRRKIAENTTAFWLDTNGAEYEFRAGQHADFVLAAPHNGSDDTARTFSMASVPHEKKSIMIAMRMRETGFKTALATAPVGTLLKVSRPRGSFTLHKDSTRPAVFLAGGIGITPIRSILHSAIRGGAAHKLYLFYSNRTVEDTSFLPELEELAMQNQSFVLVPTVTRSETSAWPYEKGRIDQRLLTRFLPEFQGPIYYVAGPSGLVAAMSALLRDCGVSEDDIRTEEFGDYGTPVG